MAVHSPRTAQPGARRGSRLFGLRAARSDGHPAYALADEIEGKLPAVDVPVRVVRGARDPLVPQQWAERVAMLAPHGRLAVVPGAGHAGTTALRTYLPGSYAN